MNRPRIDKQPLRKLIDNKIRMGVKTITYEEVESLLSLSPRKRYCLIYNWYHKGTTYLASLMNRGYKWTGAFSEAKKMGYRFLKANYDQKTGTGYYDIINTEKKHDDYESSNEGMIEIKLANKYTLTDSMEIERQRRFIQIKLDELNKKNHNVEDV
jgi:hypothetical protein